MSCDTLETLFGRAVVFSFAILVKSWEVPGSGLGTFLDRFFTVLKTCPTGSKNDIFKNDGVFSLSRGASE